MRGLLNVEAIFSLIVVALMLRPSQWSETRRARVSWLEPLAVFVATLVAFAWTQRFYFLSDDFVLLTQFREPWPSLSYFFTTPGGDGFFRPIGNILFRVNFAIAGMNPTAWHWSGFIIHALNACLVWLLTVELRFERTGRLFAAGLFALHGSRPEAVVWIAGRFDLFAACLALLSLYCVIRGWGVGAVIAMVLAVLCKESAYTLPLLVALLPARRWRLVGSMFAAAAVLGLWRLVLFAGVGGYAGSGSPWSAANALLIRLWAVLFFPVNWTRLDIGIAVSAGVAATALAYVALRQRARWEFAVFAVVAAMPAISQLAIGADLQKSRVLYLPVFGLCLLLGEQIRTAPAVALLGVQLFFLEHNLIYWRDASIKVRQACESELTDTIPNSIDGVYALANGRQECVTITTAVPN